MSENATIDELMGQWRCTNEDPLTDSDMREKRDVVLAGFMLVKECTLGVFHALESQLKAYGLSTMVSLFPEENFNVLTLIEYSLHFVAFALDDLDEFEDFRECSNVDFSQVLQNFKIMLSELKGLLRSAWLLNEEQELRVDDLCRKISNSLRYWEEVGSKDENSSDTEPKNEIYWQPFYSEEFSTEKQEIFMKGLRKIYLKSRKLHPTEILRRLDEIFLKNDLDTILDSDVLTNTAMQLLRSTVLQILERIGETRSKRVLKNLLVRNCAKLNSPTFLHASSSVCFRKIAVNRISAIHTHLYNPVPF